MNVFFLFTLLLPYYCILFETNLSIHPASLLTVTLLRVIASGFDNGGVIQRTSHTDVNGVNEVAGQGHPVCHVIQRTPLER